MQELRWREWREREAGSRKCDCRVLRGGQEEEDSVALSPERRYSSSEAERVDEPSRVEEPSRVDEPDPCASSSGDANEKKDSGGSGREVRA
jgi:hypothetical protein